MVAYNRIEQMVERLQREQIVTQAADGTTP
jgi:hypothetical protein